MADNARESIGEYFRTGVASNSAADADVTASSSTSPDSKRARLNNKPRGRQRAQLSCDRCRRLKRKCDRQDPCSECTSIGSQCTFQRATETKEALLASRERRRHARRRSAAPFEVKKDEASSPSASNSTQHSPAKAVAVATTSYNVTPAESTSTALTTPPSDSAIANPTVPGSCGGVPAQWGSDLSMFKKNASQSADSIKPSVQDIGGLLREEAFLQRFWAIWWRELEWMHGVVYGTPVEQALSQNMSLVHDVAFMARYGGLLYAMLAMCALVAPSDVEAILVGISSAGARHGFIDGDAVGAAAHAEADRWLINKTRTSNSSQWTAEVFQTALIHAMYVKYSGNWDLYKEMTSRDMARMQRCGYLSLSQMMRDGVDEAEIASRYMIFWRFFVLDRVSSLFDGVPYALQARNADIWLFPPSELEPAVHVRALCRDSGAGDWQDAALHEIPTMSQSLLQRLKSSMSPYSLTMTLLAALAGRCSDRLNTMSQVASLADNYARAEQIAAETDDDLLSLEAQLPTNQLTEHQQPMVTMTIARIRRDVTTRLSRHITKQHRAAPPLSGGEDAMVQTLNRRCLNTAKSLIRRSTAVCGFTPVRAIAMPFFTLFVAETMVELLQSVEESAANATPRGALDSESKDDLKHALIGRNFLVLLSRNSEMHLNAMVTHKACEHVSAVMRTCLRDGSDADRLLLDASRVMDPDEMLESVRTPPHPLASKGSSPQRAEDVLEFLGSLTSLQRIFEMGGQSWSE